MNLILSRIIRKYMYNNIPYTCYAIYKADQNPVIRWLGCAYLPLDLYWQTYLLSFLFKSLIYL